MVMNQSDAPSWVIEFYADHRGLSPVIEYLQSLSVRDRAKVARYLQLLGEFGPSLAMPHARHIEGRLWELRPDAYRVLYVILTGRRCVLLNAFPKKTRATPRREIDLALRRLNDLQTREEQEET